MRKGPGRAEAQRWPTSSFLSRRAWPRRGLPGKPLARHRRRADDRARDAPRAGGAAPARSWWRPIPSRCSPAARKGRRPRGDDARRSRFRLRPHLRGAADRRPAAPREIIVNLQGDLPTLAARHLSRGRRLADSGRRHRHAGRRDHARRRSAPTPTWSSWSARRSGRVGCARSISPARRRPRATDRSITTSASTPYRRAALARFVATGPSAARAARTARAAARARGRHAHRRHHRR